MKHRSLLAFFALLPLASIADTQSCPGCSLGITTFDPVGFGTNDPGCSSSAFLDIWGTGSSEGDGSCQLGLDIETGAVDCRMGTPCTISWSYGVTASGSCGAVALPTMTWSYTSSTGTYGQTGQTFEPNLTQSGSSSMQCGSAGEIQVVHDGVQLIQSATCNPCDPV